MNTGSNYYQHRDSRFRLYYYQSQNSHLPPGTYRLPKGKALAITAQGWHRKTFKDKFTIDITIQIGEKVVKPLAFNIRLPGQYYDEETELHYNYYRDYDPSLGRYIQSDPRGIKLDFSDPQRQVATTMGIPIPFMGTVSNLNHIYGYSDQNPIKNIDQTGESIATGQFVSSLRRSLSKDLDRDLNNVISDVIDPLSAEKKACLRSCSARKGTSQCFTPQRPRIDAVSLLATAACYAAVQISCETECKDCK